MKDISKINQDIENIK
jgi:hypothetical protein